MTAPGNVSPSVGRILSAFKPQIAAQKIPLIGGMTFVMLATLVDLLQPWRLKYIYDHVFGRGRRLAAWPMLQGLDSRRPSEGLTTILIAHHLAAVSQVDRVVYLQEGQIVEEGTHEELMARSGRYAAACRLQAAENNSTARLYAEA